MKRTSRTDMFIVRMGIDALLSQVQQNQTWWRARGDNTTLHRAQQLEAAIRATRSRLFTGDRETDSQFAEAIVVAEWLRDAAKQCREGQGTLNTRLISGAETIERLCRLGEV